MIFYRRISDISELSADSIVAEKVISNNKVTTPTSETTVNDGIPMVNEMAALPLPSTMTQLPILPSLSTMSILPSQQQHIITSPLKQISPMVSLQQNQQHQLSATPTQPSLQQQQQSHHQQEQQQQQQHFITTTPVSLQHVVISESTMQLLVDRLSRLEHIITQSLDAKGKTSTIIDTSINTDTVHYNNNGNRILNAYSNAATNAIIVADDVNSDNRNNNNMRNGASELFQLHGESKVDVDDNNINENKDATPDDVYVDDDDYNYERLGNKHVEADISFSNEELQSNHAIMMDDYSAIEHDHIKSFHPIKISSSIVPLPRRSVTMMTIDGGVDNDDSMNDYDAYIQDCISEVYHGDGISALLNDNNEDVDDHNDDDIDDFDSSTLMHDINDIGDDDHEGDIDDHGHCDQKSSNNDYDHNGYIDDDHDDSSNANVRFV